jgi:hypothetical protein
VTELVLRGIFLLRKKEVDWFYQGGADFIYPDAWALYEGTHIHLCIVSNDSIDSSDSNDLIFQVPFRRRSEAIISQPTARDFVENSARKVGSCS